MNKRMRELLAKMEQKRLAAKGYMEGENKDLEKAQSVMNEVDDIQKEFDLEKRMFEAEKANNAPTEDEVEKAAVAKKEEPVDGFKVIAKKMKGKRLSEAEKALIVGGDSGEDYLLPEDVRLEIRELRRQYVSAKDLVTINSTDALTGSFNYEAADTVGLSPLVDGQAIDQSDQPAFTRKPFAIDFYAKIIPISNILQGAEKAGLMSYINKWFIKNAIYTENNAIFEALKTGKTLKALAGWEALKKSINTDLDPAVKLDAVIVTNQNGFAVLDEEKDENGRPILQPNPANPTEYRFQGLPIRVFSNAQLPDVSGVAPIFYGSLKAGAEFMDYQQLQFATSGDYLFNLNQTAIRVIEGFDVIQADADAYIYGTIAPTADPA